ncbi:MAG TPA: UDP-2,3-diacylglucosamine diphosphatase LpxI [Candidatus Avidesulfovibrio excrementigallinarum]|nr:UDP-2,3-diacylglucosamine diphosphatase LpxI [Candidatus Avidesulfovibrio excrementigallinarum]
MNALHERIGIIAGSGQFPRLVARGAREAGYSVAICGLAGNAEPALAEEADAFEMVALGQLNAMLRFFKAQGVVRLCMAGAVSKPRALDLRPDTRAVKLLFTLRDKGDDAILRALVHDYESEGLLVVGAADLVPALRCPAGVLGRVKPSEAVRKAVAFGWPRLALTGRMDIGQCMVVRENMVMAIECLEGTDATLRRGGTLGGAGCVALKMPKPGQEERVDLPSVGLETVRLLVELDYAALVVEAGRTLFFDREEALNLADRHKLCVLALTAEESRGLAAKALPLAEGVVRECGSRA